MNPIRLGVIGGGVNSAVGYAHFCASRLDNKFQFVAGVFSRNSTVNLMSGAKYGINESRIYNSVNDFLICEKDSIDAVLILTPTPSHYQLIEELKILGKPVICEKSVTANLEEANNLKSHFSNSNLYVIYNYTGYPMVREIKQIIAAGLLGSLISVNVEMPQSGFIKRNKGGGVNPIQDWRSHDGEICTLSLDLGVHVHSLIKFTCGLEPTSVFAQANHKGNYGNIIDSIHALVAFDSDIIGNIWYGKTALGNLNGLKIRIYGTMGSAEWCQNNPDVLMLANGRGSVTNIDMGNVNLLEANKGSYNRFKPGHATGFIESLANYYYSIASSFDGKPDSFILNLDDAIMGIEFVSAIEQSFKSSAKITL